MTGLRAGILFLVLAAGAFAQQPTIQAVVNAASFAIPGLPGSDVGQGSIAIIFGKNLGPATLVRATALPLSSFLGGTSVRINSGTIQRDAIMLYTSASQVAILVPSTLPPGSAIINLTYNGLTSPGTVFNIVAGSFGSFTQNQAGSGAAIAFNFISPGNEPLNTPLNPALPGQVVTVWGTGLGPISVDESRPTAQAVNTSLDLLVGGQPAVVEYKGRSSCCSGVDQINFRVPSGVTGCHVPVAIRIAGVLSNFASISIVPAAGQSCKDPVGLVDTDITAAKATGTWKSGLIELNRTDSPAAAAAGGSGTTRADTGTALFYKYDASFLGAYSRPINVAAGTCTVYNFRGKDPVEPAFLPAPTAYALNGLYVNSPAGGLQLFQQDSGGSYYVLLGTKTLTPGLPVPAAYLDPGVFSVGSSRTADLGAFTSSFTLAPGISWSNKDDLATVDRTKDLRVVWLGGEAGKFVQITGSAVTGLSDNNPYGAAFACIERAELGQFTIPSYVLSTLPATVSSTGLASTPGRIAVGGIQGPFSISPTPQGLDRGLVTFTNQQVRPVPIQ